MDEAQIFLQGQGTVAECVEASCFMGTGGGEVLGDGGMCGWVVEGELMDGIIVWEAVDKRGPCCYCTGMRTGIEFFELLQ